ncbi:hypothetical protein EPJ66_11465 [Brachyspira aalborgi]|uniref:Lipoprotein n=1 Tax=Brachyspira aalborgi TaxID=29522 RepID=A0A5C8FJK0_9SPIR|nr:hypothetical protein [Brachyspira aalborgi]TXJ40471.1 hypothetical protein EPJ81_02100 [Brachyspira aalborgi]TXJ49554.1 hypothetical protein EPJ66_11465 [Brachyspira aalborgi]
MTQKNILKILVIMIAVLSLFAVSCRKASTSPEPTPTPSNPTDPIKNLTGNLLIVSTDGKTNLNSLPLSFVGASATVTEVTEEQQKLNLETNNFIIADGTLKLTNIDLSSSTDAAVSNKIILTFSLSGENLSRYTDTAEIFVGKYSNIYTNTFQAFTNIGGKTTGGILNADVGGGNGITFKFDDDTKTYFNTNTFYITNDNQNSDASVPVKGFADALTKKLKENTIIKTYFNVDSIKVTAPIITDTKAVATFKVDLTPNSVLFETPYKSYDFIIDPKGTWKTDN